MALLSRRFLARRARPHIVVAGGNFAGLAAARALDPARFRVTVVDPSAQVEWLPNIHELLSRRKTAAQLTHDRRMVVERLGHDFVHDAVSHLDRGQQSAHTAGGLRLDYDALVLATGGVPQHYDVPGVADHALPTKSVADCQRLGNALTRLAALPGARPVVVVGGGIEGIEMLGEICRRFGGDGRLELHLVEAAPRLFARYGGLHEHLLQRLPGVSVQMGARVARVDKDAVQLADGRHLPSRLTLWTAGSRGHPLLAAAGLCADGEHATVNAALQSTADARLFVIGDAAALPVPLEKQAYHAQDMGLHLARVLPSFFAGRPLPAFVPQPKPQLVSVGEREGLMLFDARAIASPALLALKEAIYQYGYHRLMPPRTRGEVGGLLRDLRQGALELDAWRTLAGSAETRVFQAS